MKTGGRSSVTGRPPQLLPALPRHYEGTVFPGNHTFASPRRITAVPVELTLLNVNVNSFASLKSKHVNSTVGLRREQITTKQSLRTNSILLTGSHLIHCGLLQRAARGSGHPQECGKRFTFNSSISSSPPAYAVGDKVTMLYHPANPRSAQINTFHDRWMFPLIFTFVGLGAVAFSFAIPRILAAVTGTG